MIKRRLLETSIQQEKKNSIKMKTDNNYIVLTSFDLYSNEEIRNLK